MGTTTWSWPASVCIAIMSAAFLYLHLLLWPLLLCASCSDCADPVQAALLCLVWAISGVNEESYMLIPCLFNISFCNSCWSLLSLSFSNQGVIVSLGWDNSIPWTGMLITGWLINNKFIPHSLGGWELKDHDWWIRCLMRSCLLVHKWLSSCCVLTWWKGQGSSWGPFYKGPNPIHKGKAFPRCHLQIL